MQYQLREVKQIEATSFAFAAVRGDGGVVTWGDPQCGGDSTAVREQLNAQVRQVHATSHAFAAVKDDGTVVTWGSAANGGDSTTIQPILKNVQHIQATHCAFAALQTDGHVLAWGDTRFGGDCSHVQDQLRDVYQIHASGYAFAALRMDGRAAADTRAAVCSLQTCPNHILSDLVPSLLRRHHLGCALCRRRLLCRGGTAGRCHADQRPRLVAGVQKQ